MDFFYNKTFSMELSTKKIWKQKNIPCDRKINFPT